MMSSKQLTLFDHAMSELSSLKNQGSVMPIETKDVAKYLRISSSTLNRAKNRGNLPYKCLYNDQEIAEVHFSHQAKGKDYWRVYIKDRTADQI